ncbi:MAG: UvrD-helicase domain-containing protein [Clostridia bacterium]|jgi:hypothetical protein|nr:UvrD-helicase domain-containing protein [Clostridia bacterium]
MQSNNLIRICAAGAGKTYSICHEAIHEAESKRTLIITYTNRGINSIRKELCYANRGVLPVNVDAVTWYTFLLKEMIKPYQTELYGINELNGLNFLMMHEVNYAKKGTKARYVDKSFYVRAEVASELAIELNSRTNGAVLDRLERIYSHIYIDEVQDMAGYDLNLIELLMRSGLSVTIVGDGKQATFQTHYARKNKNKSGQNFWDFFAAACKQNLAKIQCNLMSRRFNGEICNYANRIYPNNNNISTLMNTITGHDGVFLIRKSDVGVYYNCFTPVVLKYDIKTDTLGYTSYNFGECKGMTFDRILIFPNKTMLAFLKKGTPLKSPQKYYVAVTRPRYSIAIVVDKFPNNTAYEFQKLKLIGTQIDVLHVIPNKQFDINSHVFEIKTDVRE